MNEDNTEQPVPFDFGTNPVSVNTYLPNISKPNKFVHRLHKPTIEQWILWGHEIYEERRNFSLEEIERENSSKDESEHIESGYEKSFNEYHASRRLYEAVAIDVTTYKPDENEKLQPAETRPITPEILERAILNTDVVISGLYKSYCELEQNSDAETDEIYVRQTIGSSDSPPAVLHILRRATDDEQQKFQNESLRTYGVAGEQNTIRICLNLRVADDFYNAMLLRVDDATVDGQEFSESTRKTFLKAINPVFKLKVLEEALQAKVMNFDYDYR